MIPCHPDKAFCDAADEGAALGLLGLMTGLSEEHWCAGWLSGLEDALWNVKAGQRFGMGEITERQATLLRLLSEECDGWWVYNDGAEFIRLCRMGEAPRSRAYSATAQHHGEDVMNDPAILFVKPEAISAADKAMLQEAGILVIEINDPANAKFVRAAVEINGTEMLEIAAKAIKHSEAATKAFGNLMVAQLMKPRNNQ